MYSSSLQQLPYSIFLTTNAKQLKTLKNRQKHHFNPLRIEYFVRLDQLEANF